MRQIHKDEVLDSVAFLRSVLLTILQIRQGSDISVRYPTAVSASATSNPVEFPSNCDRTSHSQKECPLLKFPRTPHFLVAGNGLGITRDDLVLEGPERDAYFHHPVIVQEKVSRKEETT